MGLHVIAYSNLQLTDPHEHGNDCWSDDHIRAAAYRGFARSLRGVPDHDVERDGWLGGRCYVQTPATVQADVLDMPYGSFRRWREVLARVACRMSLEEVWGHVEVLDLDTVPFIEILNFADNEGAIGPAAAADLMEDFTDEARARFAAAIPYRPWGADFLLEAWDGWRAGVALAAESGLIEYR